MTDRKIGPLGLLFVLLGLLVNKWAIESTLVPDGRIESAASTGVVILMQLCILAVGVWLLVKGRGTAGPARSQPVLLAGLGIAIIAAGYANLLALNVIDPNRDFNAAVDRMIASENRLLANKTDLRRLERSLLNLELPDYASRSSFAPEVSVIDLVEPRRGRAEPVGRLPLVAFDWAIRDDPRDVSRDRFEMWRPLIDRVDHFKHASFTLVQGQFANERRTGWDGEVAFEALARMASGELQQIRAKQVVGWIMTSPGDDVSWRIASWHLTSMHVVAGDRLLFEETLQKALPSHEELVRARTSVHQEQVLQSYLNPDFEPPYPHFTRPAYDRHPGVSVVDIDADGFDDFYVMVRMGKNMFFHNRGDGTFEEIAADLGLDVDGNSSSAAFADFDNDGDPDLFLGRTLSPSVYLVNEGGRFVDRSQDLVEGALPFFASSVSAIDFDRDGLLDIYVGTYAHKALNDEWHTKGLFSAGKLLAEFLPDADARTLHSLRGAEDANEYRNCPGPPNVLIRNDGGGRFEVVSAAGPLASFRNTYQASWADYDGDGDFDLYCANDFAPNNLFRNEGQGRFVDVTLETDTADIGFGMGVSWGDYDEDGDLDLYVTNMYSKAGRRITAQVPGLDSRLAGMSRGNSLFRNDGSSFVRVSGLTPPEILVEKAGWSWGGQFFDADNDGRLDVYALSGYQTAPQQVEGPVDR